MRANKMTFPHEGSPFSNNFRQFAPHDLQRRAFSMNGHLINESLFPEAMGSSTSPKVA